MSIETFDPVFLDPVIHGKVIHVQVIQGQAIRDQVIQDREAFSFEVRDVLWTLGICAVSLSLTPFVAFYVLLVA